MKRYKLLKDTPTIKAGTIFEEIVNMSDGIRELAVVVLGEDIPEDPQFAIQDIDNFDEWFEEIKEESTDSIHWKPKHGAEYFWIDECGSISPGTFYRDSLYDQQRLTFGNVYRTEKEAEKARDRRLAKVRLQRTSTFEPDFENCEGGWVVGYDYDDNSLIAIPVDNADYDEIVRYATEEDALKSIKENRADWLKLLGIKEEE